MPGDAHILIVEDNLPLARGVARYLRSQGYSTALASGLVEFRTLFRSGGADLVLLDLNLGTDDGLTLAPELGLTAGVGLIIMTGRDDIHDRVRGLDAGADDYLIKPFAMDELAARVRAVLRRRVRASGSDSTLRLGPVELDQIRGELRCDGRAQKVTLTERQLDILHRLMAAAGDTVRRAELLPHEHWEPGDRSVDVHVSGIRRKLAAAGMDMLRISTVRSRGYRLDLLDAGVARIARTNAS
ncbi:MAG: response regulator transcription factor [Thiohalocapsa sp.]|jgi:DNA-binding response OmpR family regulator|uniref:response regulator n=1 Tax=Thiohalocapsa sp. TaxID=2497641 RepID=UPI0025D28E60|nr:response regulator transcription factor [Thiohalocapsa sp.]MCG6940612.1 response regulator transcription factor [Thiohalocapsa sp.]